MGEHVSSSETVDVCELCGAISHHANMRNVAANGGKCCAEEGF